jgi:phospholipase C
MSAGLDAMAEYVTMDQELGRQPVSESREGPVGLGYRVPLIIASPWSRGGVVNSQVFDHTSVLQLLEKLLSKKTGEKIEAPNISAWRRAVCGDLTSVFTPYSGEKTSLPTFVDRQDLIETIHKAKFKENPTGFKPLTTAEIAQVNSRPRTTSIMPQQEKGKRSSSALPYQLYATGRFDATEGIFSIIIEARQTVFGIKTAGAPFLVYDAANSAPRAYAVKAGDSVTDNWSTAVENGYHFDVYGPNGFYRSCKGNTSDPSLDILCGYELKNKSLTGVIEVEIFNKGRQAHILTVADNAYGRPAQTVSVPAAGTVKIRMDLTVSFLWYDFSIAVAGNDVFRWRFAGRVETGKQGFSDPAMA